MKRWSARAVIATVALELPLCVACGGQARQSAADAGASNSAAGDSASGGACAGKPMPKEHRALAQTCPTERGTKEPIDMSMCADFSGAKCTKDADCTAGKNGRCILPHDEPCDTACSYDECQTDSDCAEGPCVCRTSGADVTNNLCLPGSNCKTDSDCGNCGFCSMSATPIGHDCRVDSPTYNCHTATDECLDPTDCTDGGSSYCAYGASTASGVEHWACGSCLPYPVP